MDNEYCEGAVLNKKGDKHNYFFNMLGDRICEYCGYAPEGHKSVEEIMIQITKECQTCGHEIMSHSIDCCNICECKNPVFGIPINK